MPPKGLLRPSRHEHPHFHMGSPSGFNLLVPPDDGSSGIPPQETH